MSGPAILLATTASMYAGLTVANIGLLIYQLRCIRDLRRQRAAAEVALVMVGRSESPSGAIIYTTLAYDLISIEWRDRAGIHHSGHLCPAGQVEIIVRDTP